MLQVCNMPTFKRLHRVCSSIWYYSGCIPSKDSLALRSNLKVVPKRPLAGRRCLITRRRLRKLRRVDVPSYDDTSILCGSYPINTETQRDLQLFGKSPFFKLTTDKLGNGCLVTRSPLALSPNRNQGICKQPCLGAQRY